ncbi:MAG: GNAT family N-acetyltransferase [Chloroflexi bacterium]|nr:GNAT family N-acetyltransferase [Chloroflexota bacterium]
MIQLIPMEQKDFEVFLEQEIIDYAQDKVRNGNWTAEEAVERSRKEFQDSLPDGVQTKDQFIYSIIEESSGHKLGALWVEVKSDTVPPTAFIYDFVIEEQFRGKGFGRQALTALDEKLLSMNVESVGLHVFGDNLIAQELYKKTGYKVTNINMKKTLKG